MFHFDNVAQAYSKMPHCFDIKLLASATGGDYCPTMLPKLKILSVENGEDED
jgi:hypothetical protein